MFYFTNNIRLRSHKYNKDWRTKKSKASKSVRKVSKVSRYVSTSHKNCAKLFTASLLEPHLRDACIKDFHRVSRNCRMRFAFRVLWSAVMLSTEARTLTTFPIVCGTQPPSRQMSLTLPRSCVSNNARGANRCVLHMCAWRTVASGWARSNIRYANFCVNST